jgi:hypothetical protein
LVNVAIGGQRGKLRITMSLVNQNIEVAIEPVWRDLERLAVAALVGERS